MGDVPLSPEPDDGRNLVVIGASAGGVEALRTIVAGLPADLAAALCVVVHIAPSSPSALARILARAGPLTCRQAVDCEPLQAGVILVARPDHHLMVEDGRVRLTSGPRENGHRPAIDVLFRSAASAKNGRVIGVVLSGNRDDGTAGLAAIAAGGGATIVQDPQGALYSSMPASAIAHVEVNAVVALDDVARTIVAMVNSPEVAPASNPGQPRGRFVPSDPAISSCPECGGVLTEEHDSGVHQWRCEVGHRYSPESLADAQAHTVEAALWTAIRALEERGALLDRMAQQCEGRDQVRSARNFRRRATDAREQAQVVRTALRQAAGNTLRELAGDTPQAEAAGGGDA